MEAVIATGGKQYRVSPGQVIKVERLGKEKGATVQFDQVLLVNNDGQVTLDEVYSAFPRFGSRWDSRMASIMSRPSLQRAFSER